MVMTALPEIEVAERFAGLLVENRLAACVQINPEIKSVYMWDGAVQKESEILLLIKTTSSKFGDIEKFIKENHPYTVPEILAVPVSDVSDDYLKWMREVL